MSLTRSPVWIALTLALTGCGASPALRDAAEGKVDALRASLVADLERGALSNGDAVRVARTLAGGEIKRAEGDDGIRRVRAMASCAKPLDGALDDRAVRRDGVGAVAMLIRIDAGLEGSGGFERWLNEPADGPNGAFRAVGARSLAGPGGGIKRRKLFLDPDPEVRSSAFHSSIEAEDASDTEALIDAARLDPHPDARKLAIRAAGSLGGERIVLALRDLWPGAEDKVREAIAEAWALPASLKTGGREELYWAVTTQSGKSALKAALALIRAGGEGSGEAIGVIERAVSHGPLEERVYAIESAPMSIKAIRDAIGKVEMDQDKVAAAHAMGKRLDADPSEGGAAPGSPARTGLLDRLFEMTSMDGDHASAAKVILARAGEKKLVPVLEADGKKPDDTARAVAGAALAELGDLPRAAIVAADPSASVRAAVSCAILRVASR